MPERRRGQNGRFQQEQPGVSVDIAQFLAFVQTNNTREVKKVLTDGFAPDDVVAGEAFRVAISNGRSRIVKILLESDVIDPNIVLADGSNPLVHAIRCGKVGAVDALLACERVNIHQTTQFGTALQAAKAIENPITKKVKEAIEQRGGDPNPAPPGGGRNPYASSENSDEYVPEEVPGLLQRPGHHAFQPPPRSSRRQRGGGPPAGGGEDEQELQGFLENIGYYIRQQREKAEQRWKTSATEETARANHFQNQFHIIEREVAKLRRDLQRERAEFSHTVAEQLQNQNRELQRLQEAVEEETIRAQAEKDRADENQANFLNLQTETAEAQSRVTELEEGITLLGVKIPRTLPDTDANMRDLQSKLFNLGARLNDEMEKMTQCPVCMDAPRNTALSCGHQLCEACSIKIGERDNQCPLCRRGIERRISLID